MTASMMLMCLIALWFSPAKGVTSADHCAPASSNRMLLQKSVAKGELASAAAFNWKLAGPGESCDVGCASYGMFCHGSQIFSVDSSEQVIAAAQEAGQTCNGTAGWGYENMPAICSDASCCGGNCVGICAYGIQLTNSCGGSAGGSYSRLCPCGTEAEVTTTTTTPPTVIVAKPKPPGFERSLFLLPKAEPMLMLATIPAASKTGNKEPAILSGISDAAAQDFVTSFQPETSFMVGAAEPIPGLNTVQLEAASPCSASVVLAKRFWPETSKVVVAKCDDYAAALMAAPLAAKQSVPLILDDGSDLTSIFTGLKVTDVIYVGSAAWSNGAASSVTVSTLHTAGDVFNALGKPEYLAVVNPADQSQSQFQSLSALAPILATLRNGAVLPLEGHISAATAKDQIQRHVDAHGMPKFLALVGGPQAIPLHCETGTLFNEEKCRDAPYGDLDEDMFMDVALGRVVARDLGSGSLLVSRIANYEYVRDPESEGKYAMGGKLKSSADTWRPALENVGFAAPEIVKYLDILKLRKLHVSAFLHLDHAGAGGMGHSFSYASEVLFSPSIFSSGGCSTAGIDKLSDPKDSVVLTLLHYGAVGFLGGPRNAITGSGLVHSTFWNQIALKKTMGEAFKDGWNNIAVNFQDQPSWTGGEAIAKYVMMNIALFGDPAFQLFIPGSPQQKPAHVKLQNDGTLVALGPERWTKYKADQSLADEWSWHGNLYYFGAPGASSQKWYGHGHDNEYPYLYARFTTTQDVVSLKAIENVTLPLGWTGPEGGRGYIGAAGTGVYVDKHPDGSRTLLWRVRLLDYDCETGDVKDTFVRQSYEIITTTTVTTMSPSASCKASCTAAGFCCGTNSGCALPSCHQGCEVGLYEETVWSCIEKCQTMTECFQWNVAWGQSNLCTSCAETCDGQHCEPPGGCEHACHSLGLPAPPTTTTTTPPGPLQICKMKCAADGFCCGRDSGCERPSCQIGCELALTSATKAACVESCKGMTGCFNEVTGPFGGGWANQCTSCSSTCNGDHCEAEHGCEQACSNVFG